MCFHHATKKTGNIVYVTLLAESHGRMMENLKSLSYYHDEDISQSIHYMGGYHVLEKEGLKGFLRLIAGIVKEKNASILMIDGMSTIGELEQSAITFRKFAHELNSYLASSGCTAFLLSSMEGHLSKPEHTMVDGIICFHYENSEARVSRQIEVRKFRGSGHFYGKHLYKIDDNGITIYPRIESGPSVSTFEKIEKKRMTFNVPGLDQMLGSGVYTNTVTTLVGSAGTGKTTLALQFLSAGAQAGENCVFFGFYEQPDDLLLKANAIGIDIERWVKKDKIHIMWNPALEQEMDELAFNLIKKVKETGAKRVVIDGVDGITNSVSSPARLNRYLTALIMEMKKLGVTVMLVEETSIFGPHKGRQVAELSAINEVVLYMHHSDFEGEMHNCLTILKMRNTYFDKSTKKLLLSDKGIIVEGVADLPDSVITNKSLNVVRASSKADTKKKPIKKRTSQKGRK